MNRRTFLRTVIVPAAAFLKLAEIFFWRVNNCFLKVNICFSKIVISFIIFNIEFLITNIYFFIYSCNKQKVNISFSKRSRIGTMPRWENVRQTSLWLVVDMTTSYGSRLLSDAELISQHAVCHPKHFLLLFYLMLNNVFYIYYQHSK